MLRWLWRRMTGRRESVRPTRLLEREIDEELEFHLEMRVRENLAAGKSRDEAEEAARRRLGELGEVRAAGRRIRARAARSGRWRRAFDGLRMDARFALRGAMRRKGFTAVAVATLALGIGASTVMFSVMNTVVLRPLPYPEPDDLTLLLGQDALRSADVDELRSAADAAEHLSLFGLHGFDLTGVPEPQRLRGMAVTAGFFDVLGVSAALGRTFVADDHRAAASATVVLGHDLWRRISADTGIVGRTIRLNGRSFVVVGVMPAGFRFELYSSVEAWAPAEVVESGTGMGLARIAPGATIERLQAQLSAFAGIETAGGDAGELAIGVEPLVVGRGSKRMVLFLSGAVGLVLLIACVNVANLLLARVSQRRRELGIRAALGAGHGRLARQVLTESALLALAGGAAGLALASWLLPLLVSLPEARMIWRIEEAAIDPVVLLVALGTALATGLLFGSAPVLALRRHRLSPALQSSSRGTTSGHGRLRDALVVAEVAMALTLVIGAGLFVRTLWGMLPSDPGFAYRDRVTFEVEAASLFPDARARGELFQRILDEVSALPEVDMVAATTYLPYPSLGPEFVHLSPEGREDGHIVRSAGQFPVSPGFFEVMEIPILAGQSLRDADGEGAAGAVISATAAELLWPGFDPVGRRLVASDGIRDDASPVVYTVVGVAADAQLRPQDVTTRPLIWTHFRQQVRDRSAFVVKTRGAPEATLAALRRVVRRLAPDLPVTTMSRLEELLTRSVDYWRFIMLLMSAFGGTALLLSLVGIFGVVSHSVARRTRELGVRLALGARPAGILALVLRQGLVLVLVGSALGVAGALALGRLVEAWLLGVEPTDPATLATVTGLVVVVALGACLRPALRAMRVDPLVALQAD